MEPAPDSPGMYRLLDGAHRWNAYKTTGATEVDAVIKNLDREDPLLYAAQKAIGPKQLTEDKGHGHQDIPYEPPWHPAGQDRREIGTS